MDYDPKTGKKLREHEELKIGIDEVHIQADTVAEIFWLKNRRPDRWRDRVDPTAPPNPERQDDGFLAALDQKAVEVWNQPAEAEGDADEDKE
ncbi:hypothetical protein [Caproicibacter sp. BJN0012]|uniref:hypothetical protein n=1 Tax=Caproicibacter sp. BJN0012 TaxID=3110227 RepID=UPI002E0EAA9A